MLQRAWQSQYPRIASLDADWSWKLVIGPAGALVKSLATLGWHCSSAFNMRTRGGEVLDLRSTAPAV
eukprot:1281460-Pyramimonas_sp.AAC.1